MLLQDVQTGAVFRELGCMKSGWTSWVLVAVAAVVAAVTAFVWSPSDEITDQDPLDHAGTAWNDWTLYEGRAAARWGVSSVYRFVVDSEELWFATQEPLAGVDSMQWDVTEGGWWSGTDAGKALWGNGPVPEEWREHWHPQRNGVTQLAQRDGRWWSSFEAIDFEGRPQPVQLTSLGEPIGGAEFPLAWMHWQRLAAEFPPEDWKFAEAHRHANPHAHPALCGRGDGTFLHLERTNGEFVTFYGWADSSGIAAEWSARGVSWADSIPWVEVHESHLAIGEGTWPDPMIYARLDPVDEWSWSRETGYRSAQQIGVGRLAWTGKVDMSPPVTESAAEPPSLTLPTEPLAFMGKVRNHRTNHNMEITWEAGKVRAREGSQLIWEVAVSGDRIGDAFEVDLYGNGKFQCAFATTDAVHLIDVLGREVQGFPIQPSGGVSAWLVVDYDRNRKYRFLVATPRGEVLNYREEAQRTPGWNFVSNGEAVAHLSHLRVGSKDFLYAGQTNSKVRLLSRTGTDRLNTMVQVPSAVAPAFRLGGSIESSTVLFIGEGDWVEERTFGTNEAVGMSRRVKGVQVLTEDVTGDGKAEVVVLDASGARTVWNQRNEQVSE